MRCDSLVLRALLADPVLQVDVREQLGFAPRWAEAQPWIDAPAQEVRGTQVHRDYCLSNIVSDIGGGIVCVIDVRGRSARSGGQGGDPHYDAAKLGHSPAVTAAHRSGRGSNSR